ncbi:MAG: hypothetical protein IT370_06750 [Deltaproteobacteria bacterium]|nr:hypothetical protein [Deltaproteobacteria bacterium]
MTTNAQPDSPAPCHIILRPDDGVLIIGAELQRAHDQLAEAERLAARLHRVVTLLLEGKVDDGTPDDAAEVERATLRQVLLRRGGPAVLGGLCDQVAALLEAACAIGGVLGAASRLIIASGPQQLDAITAQLERLTHHFGVVADRTDATQALLGPVTATALSASLGQAGHAVSVVAGTLSQADRAAAFDTGARLRALRVACRRITTQLGPVQAWLGAGSKLGILQMTPGADARDLVDFMIERAQAGELADFQLCPPEGAGGRHRLDGGERWLPRLRALHLESAGGTAVAVTPALAAGLARGLSGLGLGLAAATSA